MTAKIITRYEDGAYNGHTTEFVVLGRDGVCVACAGVLMLDTALRLTQLRFATQEELDATFEDWKEMAEDGEEGYMSWTEMAEDGVEGFKSWTV